MGFSEACHLNSADLLFYALIQVTSSSVCFFAGAGYRAYNNGQLLNRGAYGDYWGSTQNGGNGYYMQFRDGNDVRMLSNPRTYGFSVRCVAVLN